MQNLTPFVPKSGGAFTGNLRIKGTTTSDKEINNESEGYVFPDDTRQLTAYQHIKVEFDLSDWVLEGDNYIITIEHGLSSRQPMCQIYESDRPVMINEILVPDEDVIILSVPAVPDLRFAGKISITR